jgi:hypothetical protein
VFSGHRMFYEVHNDLAVHMRFMKGKKPRRPINDICLRRGLDDVLWALLERCWAMEPVARPPAGKIVELLSLATNVSAEQSPQSDWDESFVHRNVPGIAIKVLRVYLAGDMENPLYLELNKGKRDVRSQFKSLSRYANYVYVCFLFGLFWLVYIYLYSSDSL